MLSSHMVGEISTIFFSRFRLGVEPQKRHNLPLVSTGGDSLTKTDFTKQTAHINTFNMGSATLKKQAPQQQAQAKSFPFQSEHQQNTPSTKPFKNKKKAMQHKDNAPKKTILKLQQLKLHSSKFSPTEKLLQTV